MKHTVLLSWRNVDEYFTKETETFNGVVQVSSYAVARHVLDVLDAKFELNLRNIPGTDCKVDNLRNENYFGKTAEGDIIIFNIFEY